MEFVPGNIHLTVLSILLTGLIGLGCIGALLWYLWNGNQRRAVQAFGAGCALGAVYVGLILVASMASDDVLLGIGENKYFCAIDCHIAYSVVGVTTGGTLADNGGVLEADGRFYVVTLRTWFDEKTTSSRRGNGVLYPDPRVAIVVDDEGHFYPASVPAMKALGSRARTSISFGSPLRPGESYETTLVFDVPLAAGNARLLVRDRRADSIFMVGHENSPFHGKVYFALRPASLAAARR